MEALCGVNIVALNIYDMLKIVKNGLQMKITDIEVTNKIKE